MQLVYIVFFAFALYAECSVKVNTKSIFKKLGLWMIAMFCLIALSTEAAVIKHYFDAKTIDRVYSGK